MNALITVLSFIFALGVLITFHELGHYLVARLANVKVLRFSLGFGRPIWMRRVGRDQTEWAVAAIPLGGYVKMLDEREGEVLPQERPRAFNRQPVARRFAIVAAGPIANFLLAILLYWLLFIAGVPGMKPFVGAPTPGTPAYHAGFHDGDLVVRFDRQAMTSWQDLRWALLDTGVPRRSAIVEVMRPSGDIAFLQLDLSALDVENLENNFMTAIGLNPYRPRVRPVIGKVIEGAAADQAGLKAGDEILTLDGEEIPDWERFVEAVRAGPDKRLAVTARRADQVIETMLRPAKTEEGGRVIGRIGAAPQIDPAATAKLSTTVSYPPGTALLKAAQKTWDTSIFSLKMMGRMLLGEVSWRNLSGPITIADYAGQSAQLGWISYVTFLALISISLGVLNLLPIPLLDGGHLMYYLVEIIKGSPVSEHAMEIGSRIGFALLLGLMAFALYNDINRLVTN